MESKEYFDAALRLHKTLMDKHWNAGYLIGPDPVGKIHWRVTRFIRSYLPFLPGDDQYAYLQGQAYWIKSNLMIGELTREARYTKCAIRSADAIVQNQPKDGAWLHPPILGRRGFISTVEGVWASLGLLAAYSTTGKKTYLESALKWCQVQIEKIGFKNVGEGLAANYYAHSDVAIPNVTTILLWLLAELWKATGEQHFLEHTERMIHFIETAQLESGELPYEYLTRPHFMCYQYNAFEFIDLAEYFQITGDVRVRQILVRLGAFLSSGLTADGSSRYNCHKDHPEVHYWTAALAAALHKVVELEMGDYGELSERAYEHLLSQQKPNGGFDFSRRNYAVLKDSRSYPRYLSMILWHLLYRAQVEMLVPKFDFVDRVV